MEIIKFVVTVAVPDSAYSPYPLDEMGLYTAAMLYSRKTVAIEVKDVTEFGAVVSGRNGKAEAEL